MQVDTNTISWKTWLVIAIVLGLLAWYIYDKGKDSASVEQVPLPSDDPTVPGGVAITKAQAQQVRDLSNRLYAEITSFGIINDQPFNTLLAMSDTLFVATYNDYAKLYFKDRKKTLKAEISGLWSLGTFGSVLAGNTDLQNALLNRFSKLNLQ